MMQLDFFSPADEKSPRDDASVPASEVKGLTYLPDYLTPPQHDWLISVLDERGDWSNELRRRVQHYGYKYDYNARSINRSMHVGELPEWCLRLSKRFVDEGFVDEPPDQVIVNEYLPGQGIGKHVDCEPCFKETIISLSLGSDCVMDFTHRRTGEVSRILLEARSLLMFRGDARYTWYHAITPRKSDRINGLTVARRRRISVTFRKVILSEST